VTERSILRLPHQVGPIPSLPHVDEDLGIDGPSRGRHDCRRQLYRGASPPRVLLFVECSTLFVLLMVVSTVSSTTSRYKHIVFSDVDGPFSQASTIRYHHFFIYPRAKLVLGVYYPRIRSNFVIDYEMEDIAVWTTLLFLMLVVYR
jgi:hypothetical protein